MIVELASIVAGLALLSYSSEQTVKYSTHIAHYMKLSPLIVGILLISVGTDLPEIANSIFSSFKGYGDVNLGNIMGSSLSQISLILGISALFIPIKAHRKNVLTLGLSATAAVLIALFFSWDGLLTRIDAFWMILSYFVLLGITLRYSISEYGKKDIELQKWKDGIGMAFIYLILSLTGVIIGSIIAVENTIKLAEELNLPQYIVSFFAIGIGTSLPELSIALTSARQKKFGLLLGNVFGSNIIDATFALAIGPLLFPVAVSTSALGLAAYVVIASLLITLLFAWRETITWREGLVIITIYLLAFIFI